MPGNNETVNVTIKAGVDLSGVEQQVKKLKGLFNNADFKIPANIKGGFEQHYNNFTNLFKQYQDQLNQGFETKGQVNSFKKLGKAVGIEINGMIAEINKLNNTNVSFKIDTAHLEQLTSRVGQIRDQIQTELANTQVSLDFDKMFAGASKSSKLTEMLTEFKNAFNSGDLQSASNQIDGIIKKINSLNATSSKGTPNNMVKALGIEKLAEETGSATKALEKYFGELRKGINDVNQGKLAELFKELGIAEQDVTKYLGEADAKTTAFLGNVQETGEQVQTTFEADKRGMDSFAESTQSAAQQMNSLRQSTEYFFGLRNMFNLLKRGVRQAVQTVSELDKAMTETAVVTQYSVGDMWSKLPLYTEQANKLGSTIKDVYEATTLYYQQGLDTNQAIGLANETLKMARIAGMEAADATDAMTAALRGFNMEINELSAQRINDVYSKIAATTASNTEELSTAMTKTASLAHSAGMSFEGTTAFLAQMIETTREAPENLGTAMKTIIARFQEMKKNPLELVEVEGEEVSYNKIDTALQSIGVNLKDVNGQFRNLDEVFLEISSKWDSLTQTQQRYIATTAAGSRQQSRFIAMMSNYDRVTQLVEYANNAAGASQEQFGKTLESFEAKVNKLKNAWNEYLMGLANNTIIKGVVGTITKGLQTINNLIDKLSGKSDVLQSFLSLATGFIGLRTAGKVISRAVGGIGGFLDPNSTMTKGLLGGSGGLKEAQNENLAAKIYSPITAVLREISGKVDNVASIEKEKGSASSDIASNKYLNQSYSERRKTLTSADFDGEVSLNEAKLVFEGLDNKQQQNLFNGLVGTKSAIKRASKDWFNSLNLDGEALKQGQSIRNGIIKGMESGKLSVTEGLDLLGHPEKWANKYGEESAGLVSKAFQDKINQDADQYMEKYTKDLSKIYGRPLTDEEIDAERQRYLEGRSNVTYTKTKSEKSADNFNKVGSAITSAGYAISNFGMIIAKINPALEGFGAALQVIGGLVSGFGGIITGVATAATALSGAIKGLTFAAAATGIGAVIAAIGLLTWAFVEHKKHLEEIKTTAEEVTKSYEELNKTTADNIATLKQYQSEFATLAKGVDVNGYNVSLSTTEYDRYLEIVDKLAEINPDIVEGYNTQGHAIIDNNRALEETLALQKQIQKETLEEYTSLNSLEDLLAARNIDKAFTSHSSYTVTYETSSTDEMSGAIPTQKGSKVALSKETWNLAKILKESGLDESILKKYGIESFKQLEEGNAEAIKAFTKNQSKILKEAEYQLGDGWDSISERVETASEKLSTAIEEFQAVNQPVFQQVSTWAGTQGLYEEIPTEYRGLLSEGIYDIVSTETDAKVIRKQTRNLVRQLNNEFGPSSKYAKIMEEAAVIKEEFVQGLSKSEYKIKTEDLIKQLEELRDQAKEKGGAAGEALYNAYTKEIDNLVNFTENGAVAMAEALNPLKDEITAAENAFSSFEEATSSDFSTAATNMKQFFDVLDDETHKAGYGDKSFWLAAEDLFGAKALEGKTMPTQLDEMKKTLSSMFEDGATGYNNFINYLKGMENDLPENVREMLFDENGLHFEFDDENIPEIAEALGMSANTFTALLNKARQFSHISFTNVEQLRSALATSETSVFGKSAAKGEQQKIYVSETQLKTDAYDSGAVSNPEEWKQFLSDALKQGIVTIPQPTEFNELSDDVIKTLTSDLKIQNIDDIVSTFAKMGFGKQDILEYAQRILPTFTGSDWSEEQAQQFQVAYEDYLAAEQIDPGIAEGNEYLSELVGITQAIRDYLSTDDVINGNLTEANARSEKSREAAFGESGVADTLLDFFSQGIDTNGDRLDKETYDSYLTAITNNLDEQKDYLAQLGKDQTLDEETRALYEEEIQATKQLIKDMETAISLGEQSFKNRQTIEDNKTNEIASSITVDTKEVLSQIPNEYRIELQVDKQDVEKKLEETNKQIEDLESQIQERKELGVDTSALEDRLTVLYDSAKDFSDELDKIDYKLNLLNNKKVNIQYSTSGATIPGIGYSTAITYKGQNNYISSSGFYTGSAARGTKGTLGPHNHGGLTLTGEEGFEIAWLPSENRSMIVGAHGPQMVDLPPDATVWNHEQSKKIVKQKGISLGSMGAGNDVNGTGLVEWKDPIDVNIVSDKTSSGSGSSSSSKDKDPKHSNWYKEEVNRFNLNQKINKITQEIERTTQTISDALEKIGTKYADIANDVEKQAQLLNQTIAEQEKLRDSYRKELEWLANGNRQLWISLTNTSNESQEIQISTSQFITGNAEIGYSISYAAIENYLKANGFGGDNLIANAEALFNLLNQQISNLQSGFDNAVKAIEEAQKKLQELIEQIKEAFYAYENELTKIYDLTAKLATNEAQLARFSSQTSLLLARIAAGFETVESAAGKLIKMQQADAEYIKTRIQLLKDEIQTRRQDLASLLDRGKAELAYYNQIVAENKAKGSAVTIDDQAREQAAYDAYARAAWAQKYVRKTRMQDGTYVFDLDEDKLAADIAAGNISQETYDIIKEGFDQMQEDNLDLNNAISEAADYMAEIYQTYGEHIKTMADLEKDLIDAFIDAAQKEVKKLEALNSSLSAAIKSVLDQVKKSIDLRRKAEDNTKTENDIAKKQQRLNALRANTNGGNAVEIAQLEKEIAEAQQSYGRSLEDQMLSQMQTQADEAAKQRQEQIDLAKQQIEYNKQAGVYAAHADELLVDLQSNQSAIQEILASTYELGRGEWTKLVDDSNIRQQVAEALIAWSAIPDLQEVLDSLGEDFSNFLYGMDEELGSSDSSGGKPKDFGIHRPDVDFGNGISKGDASVRNNAHGKLKQVPEVDQDQLTFEQVTLLQEGLRDLQSDGIIELDTPIVPTGVLNSQTEQALKALQQKIDNKRVTGRWDTRFAQIVHRKLRTYKEGGLADFTGPAWLDGTKAKPELILNAQDTKNFMVLKDILSDVIRGVNHIDRAETYNNPVEFNINVNVDKITSDYDVDKLTARIKHDIVKDATYRNVTQVRNFR